MIMILETGHDGIFILYPNVGHGHEKRIRVMTSPTFMSNVLIFTTTADFIFVVAIVLSILS